MVQILPPKTNVGTDIGAGLGQGLARGMTQGGDIGMQRGMLKSALSQVSQMANDPNTTPFQRTMGILEALSGIPGSERYIGAVLPALQNQMLTQTMQGQGFLGGQPQGGGGQPQMPGAPQGQQPFTQPSTQFGEQPATGITSPGIPQPGEPTTAGVLPRVIPAEQISNIAQRAMQQTGDPKAAELVQQHYGTQNSNAEVARQNAQTSLLNAGIPQDQIPEAMRIGERYGYMHNLNDWTLATTRDNKEYQDRKRTLDKAFVPGFFQSLVRSSDSRERMLDRLNSPVQDLVKMGFEPEVRQRLASESLSPTEIEARIHPISKDKQGKINSFPQGQFPLKTLSSAFGEERLTGKNYQSELQKNPGKIDRQNTMLADFLAKNISPNDSLMVWRDKLVREKGYDWRQFADSLNQARNQMNLTAAQANELSEIETQPPRQSLSDIFMSWDRMGDVLKGAR